MGLFDKIKKKEEVFQQDTNQIAEHPGMVFVVHLLMEEMCEMPEKENMLPSRKNMAPAPRQPCLLPVFFLFFLLTSVTPFFSAGFISFSSQRNKL